MRGLGLFLKLRTSQQQQQHHHLHHPHHPHHPHHHSLQHHFISSRLLFVFFVATCRVRLTSASVQDSCPPGVLCDHLLDNAVVVDATTLLTHLFDLSICHHYTHFNLPPPGKNTLCCAMRCSSQVLHQPTHRIFPREILSGGTALPNHQNMTLHTRVHSGSNL